MVWHDDVKTAEQVRDKIIVAEIQRRERSAVILRSKVRAIRVLATTTHYSMSRKQDLKQIVKDVSTLYLNKDDFRRGTGGGLVRHSEYLGLASVGQV